MSFNLYFNYTSICMMLYYYRSTAKHLHTLTCMTSVSHLLFIALYSNKEDSSYSDMKETMSKEWGNVKKHCLKIMRVESTTIGDQGIAYTSLISESQSLNMSCQLWRTA